MPIYKYMYYFERKTVPTDKYAVGYVCLQNVSTYKYRIYTYGRYMASFKELSK